MFILEISSIGNHYRQVKLTNRQSRQCLTCCFFSRKYLLSTPNVFGVFKIHHRCPSGLINSWDWRHDFWEYRRDWSIFHWDKSIRRNPSKPTLKSIDLKYRRTKMSISPEITKIFTEFLLISVYEWIAYNFNFMCISNIYWVMFKEGCLYFKSIDFKKQLRFKAENSG